jgi:hypothetical protein
LRRAAAADARERFRWKHRDNPFGPSHAYVAEAGREIVGVLPAMPWRLACGPDRLGAVRYVDAAVHPAHQRRGVFQQLGAAHQRRVASDDGIDVRFGHGNERSRGGGLKLNANAAGYITTTLAPARPVRLLAAKLRGRSWGPSDDVPPSPKREPWSTGFPLFGEVVTERSLPTLLEQVSPPERRFSTSYDLDYLRWRYGAFPGRDYVAIPVESGTEFAALGIGRPLRGSALRGFELSEVLVRAGDPPPPPRGQKQYNLNKKHPTTQRKKGYREVGD